MPVDAATRKSRTFSIFSRKKVKLDKPPLPTPPVSIIPPAPPPASIHAPIRSHYAPSIMTSTSVPRYASSGSSSDDLSSSSHRPISMSTLASTISSPLTVRQQIFQEPEAGLPSYGAATSPKDTVTYTFARDGPFSMQLMADGWDPQPLYHISVGVNVWMPSSFVTVVRRSNEHGKVIGQIEMGITARNATITVGTNTKQVSDIVFKKSAASKTTHYFTSDGTEIKWKMHAATWHAYIGSHPVATFSPPRSLIVHPGAPSIGHPHLDHVIFGLLVLMRQHLTPKDLGDAVNLFNYNQPVVYENC